MDAIIAHIKNRLHRRGYCPEDASIEFIRIKDAATTKTIVADNEYYYLNSKSVPGALVIESNTHTFIATDATGYAGFNEYRFHEFSGLIEISAGVPIDLEFIRVIPEPVYIN